MRCNPLKTFGCARNPRSERSFPCSQNPSRSCQWHVWLNHSIFVYRQTKYFLPGYILPGFLETHYGVWTGSLATQATSTCTSDSSRCHSLCLSNMVKEESKLVGPITCSHHTRDLPPGMVGQNSCQSHRQPPEHMSAGARVTTAYVPASRQRAPGRPAQHHNICMGLYSPGSTKSAPLKGAAVGGNFTLILGGF